MYVRGTESTPPPPGSQPQLIQGSWRTAWGRQGSAKVAQTGSRTAVSLFLTATAAPPHPPQESSLPQTSGRELEGEHGFSPS